MPGVDRGRYGRGDAYVPRVRPGARQKWPPSPSWPLYDVIAELQMWRSYAALRRFSGGSSVLAEPEPPRGEWVFVPAQRPPSDGRWDAILRRAPQPGRPPRQRNLAP